MPFRGNGWYCYNLVNYGIKKQMISLSDITYKLIPSLVLPADYFASFISKMVQDFGEFAKVGPNSVVGCFNLLERTSATSMFTTKIAEAICELYEKNADSFIQQDEHLYMVNKTTRIEYDETRMPLYLMVLQQEAVELHKLVERVEASGGLVASYNTDAIERTPRRVRQEKYELVKAVWNTMSDDGGNDFKPFINWILESKKSCAVDGPAGSGKSFLQQISEHNRRDDY